MYKKVEYNIKKMKKMWGGGEGEGQNIFWGVGGLCRGVGLVGGQGGCERRIEVFGKIHKKIGGGGVGRGGGQVGGGGSGWWGGQGGCERNVWGRG